MGLFGEKKNAQPRKYEQPPQTVMQPRRMLSSEDQKIKDLLYGTTRPFFKNPLGHDDVRKMMMYNYLLCQQNEVLINLLNDILQKLDRLEKESD